MFLFRGSRGEGYRKVHAFDQRFEQSEIIGFEKAGNEWQFGIKFDIFSQDIPRGFENIINVFLDKCSDFVK